MTATPTLWAVLALALPAAEPARKAPAQPADLPKPADVQRLDVFPQKVVLKGADSACQLVVTATLAGDRLGDLTGDVAYEVSDPKVARITSAGRVVPLADGTAEVVARYGDRVVKAPLAVEGCDAPLPVSFANQVVPIFTKLGCNSGGCHGKLSGQNGFRLSLLGFEPDLDYQTLVKEGRGRRLFPASPENSLLLLKATGTLAHGGGKRLEVGSDEHRIIRRWIAGGAPFGGPDDPRVVRLSVYPERRVLPRWGKQQFAVLAHYSDGAVEDVTRRAQYDSNDKELAEVEPSGLVRALDLSGEAAVMVRFQEQVAVVRAVVPLGLPVPQWTFAPKNAVDRHAAARWRELGVVPSGPCTDEELVRRAYLDIAGTLPTPQQVAEFVADTAADKRDKLIDRLVDSPEHSYYFANKWADVLRIKRGGQPGRAFGTFVFHDWVRQALADDMPYDQFVREIVAAIGEESKCPPSVWYKDVQTPDAFVDNLAQVFLGVRLQCAQCHHHPYEKWGQDDYWGLAAFYGRVGRKPLPMPGRTAQNQQQGQRLMLFVKATGSVVNKRTNRPAPLKPLDAEPLTINAGDDPRQALVDWMVDAKNPFFAKAVANRYWAHFFGRGLVDPLDDMRVTNPPSNPELLDALAGELTGNGYSLKHLVRTICKSRTYQLSSTPTDFNRHDRQNYSRYYPKRMTAEVLYDAVSQVTDSPSTFAGLPQDAHAPRRAIMLPDESFQSYFLDVFGRPQRLSACECERVAEANLAQVLHLLYSEEVQQKLARPNGRCDRLAKDPRPDAEKIDELFVWALGHRPTPEQQKKSLDHLAEAARAKKLKQGYEDLLWALVCSKEFSFTR